MKNPLIEAIRQAGEVDGDPNQSSDTDAPIDVTGAPANDENVLDAEELALMETISSLDVGAAKESPAAEPEAEIPAANDENVEEPIRDPMTASEPNVAVQPAWQDQRPGGLPAVGRLAPLLCLLCAGTAAAIYFTYQALGGGYGGSDLAAMSARALAAGRLSDSGNDGSGLPPSPFTLDQPKVRTHKPASQSSPATGVETPRAEPLRPATALPEQAAVESRPASAFVDEAYPVLERAYAAFAEGDFDAAESGYRSALEIAPRHPNALEGLGALLLKTDRRDEALAIFEELLSVDPFNTVASAALLGAGSREDKTATESAIKHLVQRFPGSPQLHFALGAHYASVSRWPEARLQFDSARQLDPGNAEYLYNLAVALEHLGQTASAAKHYELALASIGSSSSIDASRVSEQLERLASTVMDQERRR